MRPCARLAEDQLGAVASDLFATVAQTPAALLLRGRLENGGVLSCTGVSEFAQPFLSVLLRRLFPGRPIVVVTAGLKRQESFQQDVETWLAEGRDPVNGAASPSDPSPRPPTLDSRPFFYPAWETLPHEGKLPHSDVISERLETLVALARTGTRQPPLVIASVVALLQRTFPPGGAEGTDARPCPRRPPGSA